MATKKIQITNDKGELVEATAPVIVSASRSTDIPAFYADWFFHRLERGYSVWRNPFNGDPSYISFAHTRFIVFWSKNPKPLLKYLYKLTERKINCYIQFTLNDYEKENLEKGVPPLQQRIETFKNLVDRLGIGHVIWRFDPMILTEDISIKDLLDKVKNIGDQLKGFTEKLVFSYADITSYRKVKANLDKNGIAYREWEEDTMNEFASRLSEMNRDRGWNFQLATCGERIDINRFGIQHNRCVDDDLMVRFAYDDKTLMDYLNIEIQHHEPNLFGYRTIPVGAVFIKDDLYGIKKKNNRDKGQRQFCECIISKDIGQYDTCPHLCEYCYANSSKESALRNHKTHTENPLGETITGR